LAFVLLCTVNKFFKHQWIDLASMNQLVLVNRTCIIVLIHSQTKNQDKTTVLF
jgi:hypothetical protein